MNVYDNKVRLVFGVIVTVLVIGGGILLSNKAKKDQSELDKINPEIILEPTKRIDSELKAKISEEEKQEIENIFINNGAEMIVLEDVVGGQAVGTAWRYFDGEKFYYKLQLRGLDELEKGFYYQGWLVGDDGFFTTGRVGEEKLYYIDSEDRSDFNGVVVTKEIESNNEALGEHVLEGSF